MADHIQVTLDDPTTIELLRSKVRRGEYASEADAAREVFSAWRQEQEELERWEREVVVAAHDRVVADPSSAIPIDEVMRRLEADRAERLKAG